VTRINLLGSKWGLGIALLNVFVKAFLIQSIKVAPHLWALKPNIITLLSGAIFDNTREIPSTPSLILKPSELLRYTSSFVLFLQTNKATFITLNSFLAWQKIFEHF
jgi:hypothetical protein